MSEPHIGHRHRQLLRRRDLLRFSAGIALAWPAAAQTRVSQVYRVALVFGASPVAEMAGLEPIHLNARAFVHALRALGYVEGQNLILERRSAEGHLERFGDIFAELVRLKTDVIVTTGNSATAAAKAVTPSVPIVMAGNLNPAGERLVESLAHPGGNVTGLTIDATPEIEAKRLELLMETLPGATAVAFLGTNSDWERPWANGIRTEAQALGLTLVLAAHTPTDYSGAYTLLGRIRVDALFVSNSFVQYANRQTIVDLARQSRLPDIYHFREAVEIGGLMSYGVNLPDIYQRAAIYVDKILKGANPADLPVEQPTKFELVINSKTAKALGLTVPSSLLARADEVIE